MSFRKYNHIVRLGHRNVHGILDGTVHVFPKIDGTNGASWWNTEASVIRVASRRREITPQDDNAGFAAWVMSGDEDACLLQLLCEEQPSLIVYGEWLVPHTIKGYEKDAWRKFYIFDMYSRNAGVFLSNDAVQDLCVAAGQYFIPSLMSIENPTPDELQIIANNCDWLMADGKPGEGIVVKNYDWYGSGKTWAKVIREGFNAPRVKVIAKAGAIELAIADRFADEHLITKTRAKVELAIQNETGDTGFAPDRSKVIPRLLSTVWTDMIDEEMVAILRKHKGVTINFAVLKKAVDARVRDVAKDLF